MKPRIWAVSGVAIAILAYAALRAEGQVEKTSEKYVQDNFVTTVGTHTLFDGKLTVKIYEEQGKLNYCIIRNWVDHESGSVLTHSSGPVPPTIEKGADWFILAKSPDEVWTFDGHESLVLKEMGPEKPGRPRGGIYEIRPDLDFQAKAVQRLVDKAPQALRDRLPEAFTVKFQGNPPGRKTTGKTEGKPPIQRVLATDIGK